MAEPASKLTERLLAAVNRERETRHWTIDEWRLRVGDEWPSESSRPLLELSAYATAAASALEECEAYAKEGWDWLGKALEALGAPTVFDIEARAAALEQAEKEATGWREAFDGLGRFAHDDPGIDWQMGDDPSQLVDATLAAFDEAREKLEQAEKALREIYSELGVPGDAYPAPVANAHYLAREALAVLGGQDGKETT